MRCMRYYVFRQLGEWAVRHGDKVCCAFSSQAEAIHAAIETAQDFGHQFNGAEVLIQGDDGQFRVVWPSGQDAHPPAE